MHVATVKAVLFVNVPALAGGSMGGYCYAGWMLLGCLAVVTLAGWLWYAGWLDGCCYSDWNWMLLLWLDVVTLAGCCYSVWLLLLCLAGYCWLAGYCSFAGWMWLFWLAGRMLLL